MLSACQPLKNTSLQPPLNSDVGFLFIYTPDTKQKNADAVLIYIDNLNAGEIAENKPLQLPITTGWHKLAVRRQSPLGAREELANFDLLIEKDAVYYARFAKKDDVPVSISTGQPTFGVVDENTGRQMH